MLAHMIHTIPLRPWWTTSLNNTMAMASVIATKVTWTTPNFIAHHFLHWMQPWSSLLELEWDVTWSAILLVQLLRVSREMRLSWKLFRLAAHSRESSLELSILSAPWPKRSRTNWSPTTSSLKKAIDSWRQLDSTEIGLRVEEFTITMIRRSSSGLMRKIIWESFPCNQEPTLEQSSEDYALQQQTSRW